jgi:hypothetical protein
MVQNNNLFSLVCIQQPIYTGSRNGGVLKSDLNILNTLYNLILGFIKFRAIEFYSDSSMVERSLDKRLTLVQFHL